MQTYIYIYIYIYIEGRTDITKLTVTFRKFCKVPKSSIQRKFTQALYTVVFNYR